MGPRDPLRGSPVVARRSTPDPLDGTRHMGADSSDRDREDWSSFEIDLPGVPGALVRLLRRVRVPQIALGSRHLFRVLIKGTGFELDLKQWFPESEVQIGFYSQRFVAARGRAEAEARAKEAVLFEWQGLSLMSGRTGVEAPELEADESEAIQGWFKIDSGGGFMFFSVDAEEG